MRRRPDLVLMAGEIWYTREDVYDLDCVARTVKGKRCRNPLEYGQAANWAVLRSVHGLIEVHDLSGQSDRADRWLAQHCELHDDPDTVDFQAPEWERFDPAIHAAVITSLEEWVAQQRTLVMDGITDRWEPWHRGRTLR